MSPAPRERSARSLLDSMAADARFNRSTAWRIGVILADRRLVTEEGCAALCQALVSLSEAATGKVGAVLDLGDAARYILERTAGTAVCASCSAPIKPPKARFCIGCGAPVSREVP